MKRFCFILGVVFFVNYANAAPYPFVVESELTDSRYTLVSDSQTISDNLSVNWNTPSSGDFEFSLLDSPLSGSIADVFSSGTHTTSTIADSLFPSQDVTWTVGSGQFGMHSILEWNNNQWDLFTVWDVITNGSVTEYIATDFDGNGVRGFQFLSGPFAGADMALDVTLATPIPAAIWLLLSGFLVFAGIASKQNR